MSKHAPEILVIDDEVQIRRFIRAGFEMVDFVVRETKTGAEGIRSATLQPPDLILLDLVLPDMDGSEVIQRLRSWSNVPIIVLSMRSDEYEKVRLLEQGADDYVVKPFGMAELLARARASLRRHTRTKDGETKVKIGPLVIDLANRVVVLSGKRVNLTRKEYRLLQILAQHQGIVVTHKQLLKEVWDSSHVDDTQYLRIFIRKLRNKIEANPASPRILITELGVGYRLGSETSSDESKASVSAADSKH
jgi:two-component system, OmpR family, KDP operon response regulator KdpE